MSWRRMAESPGTPALAARLEFRVWQVGIFVTNFRGPALPIERTDRRVEIERRFLDVGEGLDVPRAQVYARNDRPCERRVRYGVLAGDVVGQIDKAVRHIA